MLIILFIAEAEVEIINTETSACISDTVDHQGNEAEEHIYDVIPDYVNDEIINMKGNIAYSKIS